MSAGAGEDGGFLARWSRRKREAVAETQTQDVGTNLSDSLPPACGGEGLGMGEKAEPAQPADDGRARSTLPPPQPSPPQAGGGSDGPPVEPPSLDLIDKDFQLAPWLKQNVPEAWKLAALRRAWESDPAIRDFENPARDYALDWNTPGGAPGYGPLTESDDVESIVRGIFGEPPSARDTAIAEVGDSMSHPPGTIDADDDALREEPAALRLTASADVTADALAGSEHGKNAPDVSPDADAAAQHETAPEPQPVRFRKRGGGALPM